MQLKKLSMFELGSYKISHPFPPTILANRIYSILLVRHLSLVKEVMERVFILYLICSKLNVKLSAQYYLSGPSTSISLQRKSVMIKRLLIVWEALNIFIIL